MIKKLPSFRPINTPLFDEEMKERFRKKIKEIKKGVDKKK